MNFTDSPYELFMKQPAYCRSPDPTPAPKGTICEGCPYWRGLRCVTCFRMILRSQASSKDGR